MKPETEIRNLKREVKTLRNDLQHEKNQHRAVVREKDHRIHLLEVRLEAAEKDNKRLEEIATLAKRLAGVE